MKKAAPAPSWHACNVLHLLGGRHRLWQFSASNGEVSLGSVHEGSGPEPLPRRAVAKGWRYFFHRRLNVAWLPADRVFVRVVHLPRCNPDELRGMVELQLEKLSPLPVNQVVWTYQPLPHPAEDLQTVVVIVVSRSDVDGYLRDLEQTGYLPDRLEIPWLHWVAESRPKTDGTWIYLSPREAGLLALVAWWYDGVLQSLNLLQVPAGTAGIAGLVDHLTRLSWAGEAEGWLSARPAWHLVLPDSFEDEWVSEFQSQLGAPVTRQPAPPIDALATLAARRGCRNEVTADLLPPEAVARFRQQFVDRLWMRGLGALVLGYLGLVLVYFGALRYAEFEYARLEGEIASRAGAYTNALTLRERVRIFREQQGLKYAALDTLRVASELLPSELTLTSFVFDGQQKSLRLAGTVALEHQTKATEFNTELRRTSVDGEPLFDRENVQAPKFSNLPGSAQSYRWEFTAPLNPGVRP